MGFDNGCFVLGMDKRKEIQREGKRVKERWSRKEDKDSFVHTRCKIVESPIYVLSEAGDSASTKSI